MSANSTTAQNTIIHLAAGADEWPGVVAQFTLAIAAREGRRYAAWAGERMLRAITTSEGVAAISDTGALQGVMLFERIDNAAEMSFPWTATPDHDLACTLAQAALQLLADGPAPRYYRAERQLLPGTVDVRGMELAGFDCHWRSRMSLDLPTWREPVRLPEGYELRPWQIAYLDAVADTVYQANLGTLDAVLYSPFFGESPAECRKGLLAILAGKYGPIHPHATLCAFHGDVLAGVNLVIDEENRLASVVEISVHPAHQRRSVGRALLVESITRLHDAAFERVELAVTNANTRAHALYDSLGFNVISEFPVCVWPRKHD